MKTFLISRADAIGDVVLTLPMCGWLKTNFPGCKVVFLGRTYTEPVVACCEHVDAFINADKLLSLPLQEQVTALNAQAIDAIIHVFPNKAIARLASKANIPVRVGTRNRWFHWLTCNKLVALSRKNSPYHESQLNLFLLKGVGLNKFPAFNDIYHYTGLTKLSPLPGWVKEKLVKERPGQLNVILHPKSKGSAREWGLDHFGMLAKQLHSLGHRIFITGTANEKEVLQDWLRELAPYIEDMTAQLSLAEFISFAHAADGLVAASTGTLHIAAAVGSNALGLYPPMRPVHPGRWAPLGEKADYLVVNKDCNACRSQPDNCTCMSKITVAEVLANVQSWSSQA